METGIYNVQFDEVDGNYYITAARNFSDGSGGVKELYVEKTDTGKTVTIHTFSTDESTYDGYSGDVRMYDHEQHTFKSRDLHAEVYNEEIETVPADDLSKEITDLINNISKGEKSGEELYDYTEQTIQDIRRIQIEKKRSEEQNPLFEKPFEVEYNVQLDQVNGDYYITAARNFSDGSGGVKELYIQQTDTGKTVTIHTFSTDESTYEGYNGDVRMYDHKEHALKSRDLYAEVHKEEIETVPADDLSKEITNLINNINQGEKSGEELYEYTGQTIQDIRRIQIEKKRSEVESTLLDRENLQQSDSETLVDNHKSSLEHELTEAIASGDLKRIAEKRAELNQQKMEQLIKQNHQLEKQAIQAKEAAQLAKKEQAIDVYEDYLTKGKLSNEQLETLVSLDNELSAFDKVNVRLEAIERVKSANSGISLDNYEALLESIRADAGLLNELLDVEYYQMSTGSQNSTKQSLLSENSIELAIE